MIDSRRTRQQPLKKMRFYRNLSCSGKISSDVCGYPLVIRVHSDETIGCHGVRRTRK